MRMFRCLVFFLVVTLLTAATGSSQIDLVRTDYFPAELEFTELGAVTSDENFTDAARLLDVEGGRPFQEVGFDKYAKRTYRVGDSGSLSIEVVTLKDAKAAYSILTLLRNSHINAGPPGDSFTSGADTISFAQSSYWVRIQGGNGTDGLIKSVAISVSNRIGPRRQYLPMLVSHMPKMGYDSSSLRYFLGPKSLESYSGTAASSRLKLNPGIEVAEARYVLEGRSGILSLVYFQTSQAAEEYFSSEIDFGKGGASDNSRIYAKRTGPLVGILEGTFEPSTADKILSSIQFSYSVQWIYEKDRRPATVWGVPSSILGTVVRSFIFVAILFVLSALCGVGFAFLRVALRTYAPNSRLSRSEQTEITHLKMQ